MQAVDRKVFGPGRLPEALDFADGGGQALLYVEPEDGWPRASAISLIDQDAERLEATARRCGVQKLDIRQRGTRGQYVLLWSKPKWAALRLAREAVTDGA